MKNVHCSVFPIMNSTGLMGCFHVLGIIEFIICWSLQILLGSEWTLHSWRGTTRGGQSASLWRCWAWQRADLLFLWDVPSTWHNTGRGTAAHLSLLYYLRNSTLGAASATVKTLKGCHILWSLEREILFKKINFGLAKWSSQLSEAAY